MNKKAQKILFDMFWSPAGWRDDKERRISDADFAFAKSQGLMFDPIRSSHDEAVARLLGLIARLNRRVVADAFLASLSTRRLDWRSALGSYATFQHLAQHAAAGTTHSCSICYTAMREQSVDLNVLNFERLKWGGVRHNQVVYAALDLELLLQSDVGVPTEEDKGIFRSILASIAEAPAKTTSAALHKEFAATLKSNKSERDTLIAILGYCGILAVPEHPGFSDSFVALENRSLPMRHYVDMPYPACWWRREHGVNHARVQEYFGHIL
ncbi:hypothetical protein [Massilia sp. erpn]|uniref:hypothetical protein n=1 Tax=Massilia sp. erpn TaxID=2738142 RepID=UPI0021054391|nr:hypothetical protein [Massilia sp. erpn]UTY56530.1 hypothetical protein HPQ68_04640 [Massilia sp. erpn]